MIEKTAVTAGPWRGVKSTGYLYGKDCVVAVVGGFLTDKDLIPTSGGMWRANLDFITTTANACFEINRTNPAAVSAEIVEAFNLLRTSAASCRTPEWKARRDCLLSRLGATNGS